MSLFSFPYHRLRASALPYALLIASLIATITTVMLGVMVVQRQLVQADMAAIRTEEHLQSIWDILLHHPHQPPYEDQITLGVNLSDTFLIKDEFWGIFSLQSVRGKEKTLFSSLPIRQQALVGATPSDQFGLWLPDGNKPLVLGSGSKINGKIYLPSGGLRKGTATGSSYSGSLPTNLASAKPSLPALDTGMLDDLHKQFSVSALLDYRSASDSLYQPYDTSSLQIKGDFIRLRSQRWKGKIIILAKDSIAVEANASLTGVLLFAPAIRIAKGFSGSLQAFATNRIIVEEDVQLAFPSVLALLPRPREDRGVIILEKGVRLEGWLLGIPHLYRARPPVLIMEEGNKVTGSIYWNGSVEAKGHLIGNMVCREFSSLINGRRYYNYLQDFTIDAKKRSKHWLEPAIFHQKETKQILQWLD